MVVRGRFISIFDLFLLPKLPTIGSITITLFFFFEVGIYSYSILVGAVPRRVYYLSAFCPVNAYLPISFILGLSDRPVFVDIAELLELTDDTDEFKSTTFPYRL